MSSRRRISRPAPAGRQPPRDRAANRLRPEDDSTLARPANSPTPATGSADPTDPDSSLLDTHTPHGPVTPVRVYQHTARSDQEAPDVVFAANEVHACVECAAIGCESHAAMCHADHRWHCLTHLEVLTDELDARLQAAPQHLPR
jgi:hypothetical protein